MQFATNAQVSLGAGDDSLEAAQSGTVLAGAGDDGIDVGSQGRVSGGRGDDVVTSLIVDGAGPNVMAGGPGADRLEVVGVRPATYHDVMFEPCVSYDGADRGVRVDLGRGVARGHGQDTWWGFLRPRLRPRVILVGSPDADGFWAEGGRDIIRTGRGNDSIVNGPGSDRISLGAGNDRVEALGRSGDDLIVGGTGPDFVYGGYGADRIIGGRGDDELRATSACRDGMYVEPLPPDGGPDRVVGGPGRDSITGSNGPDVIIGGPGRDWVKIDVNHVGIDAVSAAEVVGGCPSTES